ncbi:NDxxF motif lipoprotein [Staphylococcus simulans]
MKQFIAGVLVVVMTCVSTGCTTREVEEAKQTPTQKAPTQQEHKQDTGPAQAEARPLDLNPAIFNKKKKNQRLTEDELKQAIQIYLNADHDITRIYEHYQAKLHSKTGISKSDAKHIQKASARASTNDNNFAQYINENRLPKGYDGHAHKINRYITNSNQYLRDIDEKIDTAIATSKHGRVSVQEVGEIEKESDQPTKQEQKKIKKILEEKHIETRAFKS